MLGKLSPSPHVAKYQGMLLKACYFYYVVTTMDAFGVVEFEKLGCKGVWFHRFPIRQTARTPNHFHHLAYVWFISPTKG